MRSLPVSEKIPEQPMQPAEPAIYVTGLRRRIYVALGWMSVVVAIVGIAIPGVPAVLFVVLAAYLFVRSSPTAHAWLRRSRWFGAIVRDWDEHRAIRRSAKYTAIGLIAAAMACILFAGLPTILVIAALTPEIIALIIVMCLPVVTAASIKA